MQFPAEQFTLETTYCATSLLITAILIISILQTYESLFAILDSVF